MVNGISTIYPRGLYKGFSSKSCVGSRVRHNTLEEGQCPYQLKHYEEITPNILIKKTFKLIIMLVLVHSCFH